MALLDAFLMVLFHSIFDFFLTRVPKFNFMHEKPLKMADYVRVQNCGGQISFYLCVKVGGGHFAGEKVKCG